MQVIPITATPSQRLSVTLNGQNCVINIYQKSTGVYADLSVAGKQLFTCVLCHDRDFIVRYKYLGFWGDLSFIDTQGNSDPDYSLFGSRYLLVYLTPDEVATYA